VDARDLATLERRGESAGTITGLGAQWIGAHRGWRCPMTTAFIHGLKGFALTRGLRHLHPCRGGAVSDHQDAHGGGWIIANSDRFCLV